MVTFHGERWLPRPNARNGLTLFRADYTACSTLNEDRYRSTSVSPTAVPIYLLNSDYTIQDQGLVNPTEGNMAKGSSIRWPRWAQYA